MPGARPKFPAQLLEIWVRLDKAQRFSLVFFTVAVLAALACASYFMNRVEYEVLYRDLNSEDAQAVAGKLKEAKKDYRVEGTSILVAAQKSEIDKLKLEVAGSGLVHSGRVGYEIFDKNQFGMTDFTEQVNLQRALEGELARTISSLSEISQARVHLVLPKDSIFEDHKEEAKASVAVRLKANRELSQGNIAGIRGLVAGAVPGLKNYNVSIVDEEGKLLSQAAGSESGRSEVESGIREQLEKELIAKVVSILEPVVGRGKVHANASVDLDVNSTEQTEESFNPSPAAVVSQQKSEERVGGAATPSGIPGTQSNQAGALPLAVGNTPERVRQSEVTNYEINKLVRHTVQPKGTIRRLSVAVILDHKTLYGKAENGKVTASSQARSQQELDACRDLVLAAVGYDKERGDLVTLENVPFANESRPEEDQPPPPWYVKWQSLLLPAVKYASFLLLFLLVYLSLFRPLKKRVLQTLPAAAPALQEVAAKQLPPEEAPRSLPAPVAQNALAGTGSEASLPESTEEAPLRDSTLDLDAIDDQIERDFIKEASLLELGSRKYAILKKKLTDRATKEPEMVSQLIRSWILERE